ncbi:MAG: hypothetical protein U0703_24395 [Anaerolineae bacterium]
MPIKHQATLIRAMPDVPEARAVFVGDVPPQVDPAYRRWRWRRWRVSWAYRRASPSPGISRRSRCAIGCVARQSPSTSVRPASFDKAALEGMAVGVPTLVASAAFDDLIADVRFRLATPDDHADLACRLC